MLFGASSAYYSLLKFSHQPSIEVVKTLPAKQLDECSLLFKESSS